MASYRQSAVFWALLFAFMAILALGMFRNQLVRSQRPVECYLISTRAKELGFEADYFPNKQFHLKFNSREEVIELWLAIQQDLAQPPDMPELESGIPICHVLMFKFEPNAIRGNHQIGILGNRYLKHNNYRFLTTVSKPLLLDLLQDKRRWREASLAEIQTTMNEIELVPFDFVFPDEQQSIAK